jgi:hypothetical protein
VSFVGVRMRRPRAAAPPPVHHPGHEAWRMSISTHDGLEHGFTHDSLDSLGHDWARIADPLAAGQSPLKVYLPRTTDLRSAYLAHGRPDDRYCKLNVTVGIDVEEHSPELLEAVVSAVDDICIQHDSFRYMHTRTVKDPERRRLIDANAAYATPPVGVA